MLKELPDALPSDNSVNSYESFGSTDHLGRRSPNSSPEHDGAQPELPKTKRRLLCMIFFLPSVHVIYPVAAGEVTVYNPYCKEYTFHGMHISIIILYTC